MKLPLWQQAAGFAARMHAGQFRRDEKTPYIAHPFRVTLTIAYVFQCDDETALTAAILHDVIEDTPADYDDLLEMFGKPVADCVAALTKDMRLREDVREEAYDEGLRQADWRAKLVKLADAYDNLADVTGDEAGAVERCRRAIAIAKQAGQTNEALVRAIAVVEQVVEQFVAE